MLTDKNFLMELGRAVLLLSYSDSRDSYVIQAADYVANALYAKYEKNNSYFSDIISSKINNIQTFPYGKFGKNAT